jgi:SpoVK/Ycf46/Vps4 family AAA+-type ATPase
MVDEAKMNLGIRLVREHDPEELTKEMLGLIQEEDIEDISESKIKERLKLDIDKPLLDEAMEELNSLTGLANIKKEVSELIRLTKYYREIDRDVLKAFSMHSVFLGNPGTGKTTVARIMGKFYKALGLLERGHVIDADGSDLIAGWVGQTALKTKDLVKSAMGGILFIDEAYSITEGNMRSGHDFGKKAIAALIKEMEDHRGEFAVIVAGYTDNMKSFIESNPGIKSRFDRTFHFEDFTENELWVIAVNMLAMKGLKADAKAADHIKKYIAHLYAYRNKFFGNARSIRKVVEKAYRNHELRMADMPKSKRGKKVMSTLTLEDVLEFQPEQLKSDRPGLGFKYSS